MNSSQITNYNYILNLTSQLLCIIVEVTWVHLIPKPRSSLHISSLFLGIYGNFFNSSFIQPHTFSIGFKSGEEGGQEKLRIPCCSRGSRACPL